MHIHTWKNPLETQAQGLAEHPAGQGREESEVNTQALHAGTPPHLSIRSWRDS